MSSYSKIQFYYRYEFLFEKHHSLNHKKYFHLCLHITYMNISYGLSISTPENGRVKVIYFFDISDELNLLLFMEEADGIILQHIVFWITENYLNAKS